MVEELKYWLGFSLVRGVGPATFRKLLGHFKSLSDAWEADPQELGLAGLDAKTVETILATRRKADLDSAMARLEQLHIKLLTWDDALYPKRLREIDSPPAVLYLRGELKPEDEWAIAVVGTRRASQYGKQVTHRIVSELAKNAITVVSGLALGIDSEAHKAALAAEGRTIAVLGSGLDIIYPYQNRQLAEAVVERGALISEFPLGAQPLATNFPWRNRIISGMSLGVVVIEAGEVSGALLTASRAAEQGREVFAVPGSILSPTSVGTNRLIQDGAKLTRNAEDILVELNLSMVPQQMEMRQLLPENEVEAALLGLLSHEPTHIDELARASGLPISQISSSLTVMELKGMVRQTGGMNFVLEG